MVVVVLVAEKVLVEVTKNKQVVAKPVQVQPYILVKLKHVVQYLVLTAVNKPEVAGLAPHVQESNLTVQPIQVGTVLIQNLSHVHLNLTIRQFTLTDAGAKNVQTLRSLAMVAVVHIAVAPAM